MKSRIQNPKSKIAIAGAGPAGSSLAIRLASLGFETTLIERESFPRHKLCGEFISPECFTHFKDLRIFDEMLEAGGERVSETRFFESGGRSVTVPSRWFGQGDFALSLSRAEMDHRLMKRARDVGVTVLERTTITGVETRNGRLAGLRARCTDGNVTEIDADLFVDATGRSRVLTKFAEKKSDAATSHVKPDLVGFKAHVRDVDLDRGVCEIYSFPGGYAGLSHVEKGLSNLCFMIQAATVRSVGSDAGELVRQVLTRNKRAAVTLAGATATGDWLAVSIDGFGTKRPTPASNLYTVGDAAAFIDPFTGSGMVMAFESAEILAAAIAAHAGSPEAIAAAYRAQYQQRFGRRLRVCSLLRRTAFMPNVATGIVALLGVSTNARRMLARATRGSQQDALQ